MKKIYIIAVVSAAICGILLYSFFSGYEKKATEEQIESQQQTEQVVVAAKDIKEYTEITSGMVKIVSVPLGLAHTNAARSIEDVVGKVTEREIASGEHILTNKIYETGDSGTSLSYEIPKGMRAMTISVGIEQAVAGYLEEGDLVDILTTSSSGKEKIVALSAVEIIRLGDVAARGGGKVNATITFLLKPKQCITLYNVKSRGFEIVLREKTDKSN